MRDLVFDEEFLLLQALQLQLILAGFFRQFGYDVVEIAVFEMQFINSFFERLGISLHGQTPPSRW